MDRRSDEQLLAAALQGDADALAQIVARYQGPLTGYLDRLVGADWSLAQDLVQETFLRVLRQRTPRGDRPFRPWLYAITTNLARDHFKSAAVQRSTYLDGQIEALMVEDVSGPEDCALARESADIVVAALNSLSVEYRATLVLRFYNDLSLQEIADVLDIPLGTVKSRLSVGLRRLRAVLIGMAPVAEEAG